jgi:dienelactone hydrolase
MHSVKAVFFALALLASTALALAQTPVKVQSLSTAKPAELSAYLFRPEGTGPHPAIVVAHGCGGIHARERNWARFFHERGYVVLTVDSFTGRVYGDTCTTAGLINIADRVGDVFGGLKYLHTLPEVDKRRIGLIGFSQGGDTVLKAVAQGTNNLLGDAPGFAAASSFYPSCYGQEADSTISLLIQIGEKDDWTPAFPCQQKVAARKKEGFPVELIVYDGAHHAFDSPDSTYNYNSARRSPLKLDFCCGATASYDIGAHNQAVKATEKFFEQHLKTADPTARKPWVPKPEPTLSDLAGLLKDARAFADSNGQEALIERITALDPQFRKRRQYLTLLRQDGFSLAHGLFPLALKGSMFATKSKDASTGKTLLEIIRATLDKSPPQGRFTNANGTYELVAERLGETILVSVLTP